MRVQRISRSKFKTIYQVVADHCGQPITVDGLTYEPQNDFNPSHDELIFPSGVSCPALATRNRLWPAVEAAELRADANLATHWQGVIPAELHGISGNALSVEFGKHLADYLGSVVHLVVLPPSMAENARLRALCTTREVGPEGFGLKNRFNLSVAQRRKRGFPISPRTELSDLRAAWDRLCSGYVGRRNATLAAAS
ncbi:MobA/MobL family protein [Pararhizobium haloflavum]|uniref:MobA/MobL family protein n=1 Tax=Pararhizobium haloflavum TaxID=2037914 RepID=UPI0012FFE43F|nr:MobA/MobL family protein [Pararhizobium haloflavum]